MKKMHPLFDKHIFLGHLLTKDFSVGMCAQVMQYSERKAVYSEFVRLNEKSESNNEHFVESFLELTLLVFCCFLYGQYLMPFMFFSACNGIKFL